ncbi:hypothetical protein DXT63_09990 [Thermoanaerobacteraceae bacterium SP2]|nr:hypothetical protein DXT63_09990 [Thermoanaerobacteraceae bacterium SP2]
MADAIFGKTFHPLEMLDIILSFHLLKCKGQKDFCPAYYKNLKVNIIKEYKLEVIIYGRYDN